MIVKTSGKAATGVGTGQMVHQVIAAPSVSDRTRIQINGLDSPLTREGGWPLLGRGGQLGI